MDWVCQDWLGLWGSPKAKAHDEYRRQIARMIEAAEIESPWDEVKGGLALAGDELWQKILKLLKRRSDNPEARRVMVTESFKLHLERVEELVAKEEEQRWQIWLLSRWGGVSGVDLAGRFGYSDGSGISQVVKRLELEAEKKPEIKKKMDAYRKSVNVKR